MSIIFINNIKFIQNAWVDNFLDMGSKMRRSCWELCSMAYTRIWIVSRENESTRSCRAMSTRGRWHRSSTDNNLQILVKHGLDTTLNATTVSLLTISAGSSWTKCVAPHVTTNHWHLITFKNCHSLFQTLTVY
jgi:hypothetical protein